jgi:hypothetical protein
MDHSLTVFFSKELSIVRTLKFQNGWNLVSIPLDLHFQERLVLFPSANSRAFFYQSGYRVCDTISHGGGFWIKFVDTQSIPIVGPRLRLDTIPVVTGWNIIGSISDPFLPESITSIPEGMSTSPFYGYNGQYIISDTIKPGFGYWVRVKKEGKLILASSTSAGDLSKKMICINLTNEMPPEAPDEGTSLSSGLPKDYVLEQSYPNPFNPITMIRYQLPMDSRINLKLYNLLGQTVTILANEIQRAGYKQVEWNARNFASGIYFYRLEAISVTDPSKTFTNVKKTLLLK